MRKVRQGRIAAFFAVFVLMLSVVTPGVAQADEAQGWPLHMVTGMTPTSMAAFASDTLAFANCSYPAQADSFQYVYKGSTASTLPMANPSNSNDTISCGVNGALFAPDGTFYTTHSVNTWNHQALTFVAMKNGRTLWETDLSTNASDPVCGTTSSWGADQYNVRMTGASIGSDGNIYGLVQPVGPHCPMYLTKIKSNDGTVIYKTAINTDQSGLPGDRLWVYSDKLLVLAQNGLLRQFSYNGTENTSASYQFPMGTVGTISSVYANADGRVFVVGTGDYNTGSGAVIAYHDLNGTSGSANSGLGVNPQVLFMPGAGGNFTATDYYSGAVTTYHISSSGITSTVAPGLPSSASHSGVSNYWQDQNGNAVMVRQFLDNNWMPIGVSVDEINGTTGVVTNLLVVGVDGTHPSPMLRVADVSPDGYLYAVICHNNSTCGNTSGSSLDGWVHKVPLSNFGAPIKDTSSFTAYTSSKRNYVAAGDSYTSGEGNPGSGFLQGTDTAIDKCHRSAMAYPELLENDPALNLNMTNFVACSGAKTSAITTDGYNTERAQQESITADTKLVTMSIGGNDMPFDAFARQCVMPGINSTCDGRAYQDALAGIVNNVIPNVQSMLQTLNAHMTAVGSEATVLIVGYPQLVPDTWVSNTAGCWWLQPQELSAIRQVTSSLNTAIKNEVEAAGGKFKFVSATDAGSPFVGHELCRDVSDTASEYFNNYDSSAPEVFTFHPNGLGQGAYAQLIKTYLLQHPLN